MRLALRPLCVLLLLAMVVGCAGGETFDNLLEIQQANQLVSMDYRTSVGFQIRTYQRREAADLPWLVFIEGDGFAWKTWREPSADPTPRNLQVLALAGQSRGANILYVARPCQFVMSPRCRVADWTGARLSADHITALQEAIQQATGDSPKVLVGYSGGGGAAVFLASRLSSVRGLVTLAGNLDHAAFTAYHDVTPMHASLPMGPALAAAAMIPQWHFTGEDDDVVPPELSRQMLRPIAHSPCVHQVSLPNVSHQSGWVEAWAQQFKLLDFVCGGVR